MKTYLLQNTIDEYNEKTKELVKAFTDIFKETKERAEQKTEWTDNEFKDLDDILRKLDTHYQVVQAYIDGVNTGMFTELHYCLTPLIYKNDYPDFETEHFTIKSKTEHGINKTYEVEFDNAITSIVGIKSYPEEYE